MIDKEKAELQARRETYLADKMDQVRTRMMEPYNDEVHDLLLYQQLNGQGVRMFDIPRLLREALKRAVPK